MPVSVDYVIALLLSVIALEAATIGYMLRHYFLRIETLVRDFELRILRLEKHAGFHKEGP